MKIKTSVSLSRRAREALAKFARAQDRSVSYILEKFIEEKATQLAKRKTKPRRTGGTAVSIAAAEVAGLIA